MDIGLQVELGIAKYYVNVINKYCNNDCILRNECNKYCPFYFIKNRSILEITEKILIGKSVTVINFYNEKKDNEIIKLRNIKDNKVSFSDKTVTIAKINYNSTINNFEIYIKEDNRENIWYSYLFIEFPVFKEIKCRYKDFCSRWCIYKSCNNLCSLKALKSY